MNQTAGHTPPKSAQQWSAQGYVNNAGFVADLGAPLLQLLAPQPGERILDLGCGDGRLTLQIMQAGSEVLGADSSPELLDAARQRGVATEEIDGQALAFDDGFDAIFSNAALHWMLDADAVIAGVFRALKPGGRFVAEFGGHGNVAAIVTALMAALAQHGVDGRPLNPWFFPTAEAYRTRLEGHGFEVDQIELIPRPTPLPTGIAGWLSTFANPFLAGFDQAGSKAVLDAAVDLLSHSLCDEQGNWHADYVRLRLAAHKQAD